MYKENKQLIHRLEMIKDDLNALLEHLEDNKSMKEQSNYADDGYTHLNNIYIALDMNDNECLGWEKFNN